MKRGETASVIKSTLSISWPHKKEIIIIIKREKEIK